jgi:hypothetical protein
MIMFKANQFGKNVAIWLVLHPPTPEKPNHFRKNFGRWLESHSLTPEKPNHLEKTLEDG